MPAREAMLSTAHLEAILDAMADALIVAEPGGIIRRVNPELCRILGFEASELLGTSAASLFSLGVEALPLQGQRLAELRRGSCMRNLDVYLRTKAGEEVPMAASCSALSSPDGDLGGIVLLLRDMRDMHRLMAGITQAATSERERAAELADSLQQLRHMNPHWLQQLLSASPVVTYSCKLVNGVVHDVWQSDNVERILGYSKAESLTDDGSWWFSNVHAEDLAAMDVQAHLSGNRAHEVMEYRFRHQNGAYRWLRDAKNCYPQADGSVLVIGSWADITEQKQAEEALRRSHAMLSAQQEGSIEGILLVDEHQSVIGFNRRFMEIWGIPDELMNERDDSRLLAYVVPLLTDVSRFRERVEYLYQHPLDVGHDEILLTDGRVLERYTAPALSPQGDLFGRAWYFRDFTERKLMVESLKKSRTLLAEAQQLAKIGGWEWDLVTGEATWSEELFRLLGCDAALGVPSFEGFLESVHPDDRTLVQRSTEELIENGKPFSFDFRVVHPTEGVRVLQAQLKLVKDASGRAIRMVGTAQDVTERKQIEDAMRMAASATEAAYRELTRKHEELKETQGQLIQAGKMAAVGTLVAGLSHELNNPIGIILGFTQSLLKRTPEGDPTRQALQAIERHAQRCGKLVKSLLDFSRKRASKREPMPTDVLLERITSLVSSQARQRSLRFKIVPCVDLPPVMADPVEIESALLNIIGNAMDATAPGGRVELTVAKSGPGVELRVSDTGSGIPADVLPKIFDPFFTTKPEGKGTGLGLSLASQMIEANGGRIAVESTVGEGTTMRVWLPLIAPEQAKDGPCTT